MSKLEIKYGQVYEIPVSDIKVNWAWNVRSGNWKKGSAEEHENDFEGLVHSIQTRGQDTPVTIIPNKSGGKEPFELTTGFRRMAAILQLGQQTIKAMVLEMNSLEARETNIRENTSRSDLKAADLAFGLAELKKEYVKAGKPWVQVAVAQSLGFNQGYVNMLDKIMTATSSEITKQWRDSPVAIPIQSMAKLADVKPEDQPEAFKKLLEQQAGKADGRSKKGKEQQLISAAERVGKMLGALTHDGYISVTALEASDKNFWKIVGVSIPEEYKDVPTAMVKAASEAFKVAVAGGEKEAEKTEKAATKSNGKGKGKEKQAAV